MAALLADLTMAQEQGRAVSLALATSRLAPSVRRRIVAYLAHRRGMPLNFPAMDEHGFEIPTVTKQPDRTLAEPTVIDVDPSTRAVAPMRFEIEQ